VAVDEGLAVLAQLGAEHDQPIQQFGLVVLELCALGLRAQADQAELAQAQHAAADVKEARRRASQLLVTLKTATGQQGQTAATTHAWTPSYTAQAQAEYSRLEGQSDPQLWQQAAESWEQLQLPYQAAYAHFREGKPFWQPRRRGPGSSQLFGLRSTPRLRWEPYHYNANLSCSPNAAVSLTEQVTAPVDPESSPSAITSLGLTRREVEVLVLVAQGRTNRQIGKELFITEKTASLHVSHILAKLGVAGRGEAAAIAHRLGLDQR
jgi:DNA-binding CsgD family transcriptional regulator